MPLPRPEFGTLIPRDLRRGFRLGFLFPFFVLWLAIIYLPFAMRSWRTYLALCAVYLLIGLGVQYGVDNYTAAEVPTILVAIGDIWLDFVVQFLPVPIIARAVVLTAKSLGLSGRRLLAMNIIGILAWPGLWLGNIAYDRWERRPAPTACTIKPISLTLLGAEGVVPWSNAVKLYLGPDIRRDGRYPLSPAHRRSICRDTSDGTGRLTVSALAIKLDRLAPDRCLASDIQPWEQALCATSKSQHSGFQPSDVIFFDPNGIRLGEFGIPSAATNDDYPLEDGQRLISITDPVLGTIKAICKTWPGSNPTSYCRMRRQITDGVDLYWVSYSPPDEVHDSLLRAEAVARSVCSSVFGLPGCTPAH